MRGFGLGVHDPTSRTRSPTPMVDGVRASARLSVSLGARLRGRLGMHRRLSNRGSWRQTWHGRRPDLILPVPWSVVVARGRRFRPPLTPDARHLIGRSLYRRMLLTPIRPLSHSHNDAAPCSTGSRRSCIASRVGTAKPATRILQQISLPPGCRWHARFHRLPGVNQASAFDVQGGSPGPYVWVWETVSAALDKASCGRVCGKCRAGAR